MKKILLIIFLIIILLTTTGCDKRKNKDIDTKENIKDLEEI